MPPVPDELEWLAQLASRFGVQLAPYASSVFAEVSERCYAGLPFGEVGERAPLRGYEARPRTSTRSRCRSPRAAAAG